VDSTTGTGWVNKSTNSGVWGYVDAVSGRHPGSDPLVGYMIVL